MFTSYARFVPRFLGRYCPGRRQDLDISPLHQRVGGGAAKVVILSKISKLEPSTPRGGQ